ARPLRESERPTEIHVFNWTTLLPVVAVVSGRDTKRSGIRIDPRILVQYKRSVRIIAVAVEVLYRKQRNAWHAVGKARSLEQDVIEIVLRIGHLERHATRILQEPSICPIPKDSREQVVASDFGCRIRE